MMPTTYAIFDALRSTLSDIDTQMEICKKDIRARIPVNVTPNDAMMFAATDQFGQYTLLPLLAAKAQILSGMAALKAADLASKAPRPGPRRS